jgi:hypothetical protein
MVHRVHVRSISNDEGNRLLRIVRRSSGSVVTWRRAQMVLLSAQGMDAAGIAAVTFTSPDRVRDVLHNFNADGFNSLRPKYAGGRPPKFRQITGCRSPPGACRSLPTSWSLRGSSSSSRARGAWREAARSCTTIASRSRPHGAVERPPASLRGVRPLHCASVLVS